MLKKLIFSLVLILLFGMVGCFKIETYTVSGVVVNESGNGLAGVMLSFGKLGVVMTDSSGNWMMSELKGEVEIKPTKTGWNFEPSNTIVNKATQDLTFIGKPTSYTIAGRVCDENSGNGVPGVEIKFSGNFISVFSDTTGNWSKSGLTGMIIVTPFKDGWTFTPSSIEITTATTELNFFGRPGYSISGRVTNLTGQGIPDVTLQFGGLFTPVTSNYNGDWVKNGLTGTVTITPVKVGYSFTPATFQVSGPSTNVTFTGQQSVPAAPGNVQAVTESISKINLSWEDLSTNETGFVVERRLYDEAFTELATLDSNVTTYIDNGLTSGRTYFYRVKAFNDCGSSAYSAEVSATTGSLPQVPGGLEAEIISAHQINLSWGDIAGETYYVVERKITGGNFTKIALLEQNITGFQDQGLSASTTYFYRIKAGNQYGESSYSDEISGTTRETLAAPTNLQVQALSLNELVLTWIDQSDDEEGFKIERSVKGSAFTQIAEVGAGVSQYRDTDLESDVNYSYQIRAYSADSNSNYSNIASAVALGVPAAPQGLEAIATSATAIRLQWDDTSSIEKGFIVERAAMSGEFSQVVDLPANTVTYLDADLTSGNQYRYRVKAYNNYGSNYSTEVSGSPGEIPPTPLDLTVTIKSTTSVEVQWVDNSELESGFVLERRTTTGTYAVVFNALQNEISCTENGLTPGAGYFYRIKSHNQFGESEYSSEVAVTMPTLPAVPTSLSAEAISSSEITLTWVDNATNESGYKLERMIENGVFEQVNTIDSDITTYTDNSLKSDLYYTYRIRAYNQYGESSYSNTASATTLFDICANTKIAFSGDMGIYVMNADGTELVRLTYDKDYNLTWSPDGSQIAYATKESDYIRNVYKINADGSNKTFLASISAFIALQLDWSPDGSKIVYSDYQNIYIMDEDGLNQVMLTAGESPCWSPDGSKILFTSMGHLCLMNADGSEIEKILIDSNEARHYPAWSPDGSKIVFRLHKGLYVINQDGSNLTKLTDDEDLFPSWSPDSSKIVFRRGILSGSCDLYVMNADGTNVVRITNTGKCWFADWNPFLSGS